MAPRPSHSRMAKSSARRSIAMAFARLAIWSPMMACWSWHPKPACFLFGLKKSRTKAVFSPAKCCSSIWNKAVSFPTKRSNTTWLARQPYEEWLKQNQITLQSSAGADARSRFRSRHRHLAPALFRLHR